MSTTKYEVTTKALYKDSRIPVRTPGIPLHQGYALCVYQEGDYADTVKFLRR